MQAELCVFSGGLAAYNNPGPNVEICAGSNGRTLHKFALRKYGDLYANLIRQGFSIIGAAFVEHNDELEGLRPAQFGTAGREGGWPLCEIQKKWRQIAFAAGRRNEMAIMDISSRIASGLEYGQSRLYAGLEKSSSNRDFGAHCGHSCLQIVEDSLYLAAIIHVNGGFSLVLNAFDEFRATMKRQNAPAVIAYRRSG